MSTLEQLRETLPWLEAHGFVVRKASVAFPPHGLFVESVRRYYEDYEETAEPDRGPVVSIDLVVADVGRLAAETDRLHDLLRRAGVELVTAQSYDGPSVTATYDPVDTAGLIRLHGVYDDKIVFGDPDINPVPCEDSGAHQAVAMMANSKPDMGVIKALLHDMGALVSANFLEARLVLLLRAEDGYEAWTRTGDSADSCAVCASRGDSVEEVMDLLGQAMGREMRGEEP